jgi:hypothetical protein
LDKNIRTKTFGQKHSDKNIRTKTFGQKTFGQKTFGQTIPTKTIRTKNIRKNTIRTKTIRTNVLGRSRSNSRLSPPSSFGFYSFPPSFTQILSLVSSIEKNSEKSVLEQMFSQAVKKGKFIFHSFANNKVTKQNITTKYSEFSTSAEKRSWCPGGIQSFAFVQNIIESVRLQLLLRYLYRSSADGLGSEQNDQLVMHLSTA